MLRRRLLSSRIFGSGNVRQMITSCVNRTETDIHGSVNQFSENSNSGNYEHKIDEEIQHDYIHTSNIQRLILSIGSSVAALINPHR